MGKDDNSKSLVEQLSEMLNNTDLEEQMNRIEKQLQEQMNETDGTTSPFGDSLFDQEEMFGGGEESDATENKSVGIYDVFDEGDEVVVVADLPGFKEDQVELTADEERVRIEATATDDMYRESITQVYSLPTEVEADKADATMQNGVLTVRFPKTDPDDQTTITID